MPHFMASYRIVYRSREMILRHKWATIYVPLNHDRVLRARLDGNRSTSSRRAVRKRYERTSPTWRAPSHNDVFISVASAYLAWHYTGQVWGMMASYAYLAGTAFDKTERLLIRTSLRILLVWHAAGSCTRSFDDPFADGAHRCTAIVSVGTAAAFIVGTIGIARNAAPHRKASAGACTRGVDRAVRVVRNAGA